MLTKSDLSQLRKMTQEVVREIVREEVGNEVTSLKDELQADITMSRMRIQTDINELTDRIKNLEIRVTKMHKDLKTEIKMGFEYLDKEHSGTAKRVDKIEACLGLLNN